MRDKKHVSVGFFGYPNVGKSSIINFLLRKKVCKAAPVPGEVRRELAVTRSSSLPVRLLPFLFREVQHCTVVEAGSLAVLQTRVWQYVSLTSKLYLIDCPGVVPDSEEAGDASDKVSFDL